MSWDVVTLGETMLRLTPPGLQRFIQSSQMEVHVGGSESNVAVGVRQLGLRALWLSRLTDNALGRRIAGELARYGVDTSYITWTDADRVGLYFLEEGRAPRTTQVIYDRANSAASRMQPGDLPQALFEAGKARIFHTSGIMLALSESAKATALTALERAKKAGWTTSFDLNYRSLLWSPEQAYEACHQAALISDILFMPYRDVQYIYGLQGGRESMLTALHERYPHATVVLTYGADGSLAISPDGEPERCPIVPAEQVERVGTGDAFVAGFLYGIAHQTGLATSLRWASASAAYKLSLPGDMPLLDEANVRKLVETGMSASITR
jgi:2-dehydro-3-deoxygluconokinase